jgi:hypothetical protein
MGGIIVKEALVQLKQSKDPVAQAILNSTQSLLFLGTPKYGLDVKKLGLSRFTKNQPNQRLIDELSEGSSILKILHQKFLQAVPKSTKIISFYETVTSPTAIEVGS